MRDQFQNPEGRLGRDARRVPAADSGLYGPGKRPRESPRTEFSESLCTENARSRAFVLITPRSLLQRLSENSVILGRKAKPWKDIEFERSEDVNDTPVEVRGT